MSEELSHSAEPPKKKGVLWVECLKGGMRHRILVYSPAVVGVFSHWTGKCTKPCYKNHKLCEGGHTEESLRWRGYVHCWSYERGKPVFMQLTDTAVEQWWAQVKDREQLRGQTIWVARSKADNGRLTVELDRYTTKGPDNLPPPMDPKESLLALWRVGKSKAALSSKLTGNLDDVPAACKNGSVLKAPPSD